MFLEKPLKTANHITGCQASPDVDGQPLARKPIDYCQTLELTRILSLVEDKIVAPDMVRIAGPMHPLRCGAQRDMIKRAILAMRRKMHYDNQASKLTQMS